MERQAAHRPGPQSAPPGEDLGLARVLIVDDEAGARSYVRTILEEAGHHVDVAETVPEALESCRRRAPQVVFTDMAMEPLDGRALVRGLRREFPSVVPIVITGYGSIETAVELMREGAFDVLTKPAAPDELRSAVRRALAHQSALGSNADLRQRLRVQEKLAMIGKLAAGVAHELNNPLDASLRCIRLMRDRVNGDVEAREYLDLAESGLQRMADIVQSLLTFSRHAAVEQAPQALDDLLTEAIASVALALGDAAPVLRQEVEPNSARVPVPRGMHQVVTNLLRNACDAGGRNGPVRVLARREDGELVIEVVDQGPGIPPDVLPRIFEPFFTTKAPGKGTGLGLPISARLVEKFGGSIAVECPSSGGTCVRVTLPLDRHDSNDAGNER